MNFEQDCRFPALVLHESDLLVYEKMEHLTRCSITDVKAGKRGRFARSTIIDSNGFAWVMDGAEVLHGVGPFWGYNIFLNRSVKVRPKINGEPKPADLNFVKTEVVRLLQRRDALTITVNAFCATIDRHVAISLIPAINDASSAAEITATLLAADFPERERLQRANH